MGYQCSDKCLYGEDLYYWYVIFIKITGKSTTIMIVLNTNCYSVILFANYCYNQIKKSYDFGSK